MKVGNIGRKTLITGRLFFNNMSIITNKITTAQSKIIIRVPPKLSLLVTA